MSEVFPDEIGPWRCSCGLTIKQVDPPPWLPWVVLVIGLTVVALLARAVAS